MHYNYILNVPIRYTMYHYNPTSINLYKKEKKQTIYYKQKTIKSFFFQPILNPMQSKKNKKKKEPYPKNSSTN